jgi:uncharacterized protein involved in exopolysaccharide biosynthesis
MAGEGQRVLTQLGVRIVLATLVAGVAAAVFAVRLDNSYRARVLLILAPMPLEQKDEVPGLVAASSEATRRVSFVKSEILEPLPMPDYKILLTSEELAAKLRDTLRQKYQQAGIDPGNLTLEKVKRSMDVRSKVHIQTQEEVQYQQVVELLFTARDPKIAADIANEWARLGIETAERMRLIAREGAVDFFTGQLDEVKKSLDASEQQLEDLEAKSNVDTMTARLAALEGTVTSRQVRRSELAANVARLEAEIAALDAALADPAQAGLAERRALAGSEVAGMRAESAAIEQDVAALEAATATLRADLARASRARANYEMQIGLFKKRVDELSVTLQSVQLSAAETEPAFKIASSAVAPEEKVAPQRTLIVLVAMFLAGVAIPVHLFGMEALRRYARALDAPEAV